MTSSLPGSFSPVVTLDPRAINLAHALDDFLRTRHIFTHELHQHTITLLTYITTFYITPKDYLDPSVSLDWALDRSSLNNSVKKFHTQTFFLRTDSHFRDWEDQYLQSSTGFRFPPKALGWPRGIAPESEDPRVSDTLPEQSAAPSPQAGPSKGKNPLRTPTASRPPSRTRSRATSRTRHPSHQSASDVTEEIQRPDLTHLPQPDLSGSQEEVPGGAREMAPTAEFTPAQEQRLEEMMTRVLRGMLQSTVLPQGPPGPPGLPGPIGPQGPPGVSNGTNGTAPWRPDELGFFDPDLNDDAVVGKGDIVYLGNHPFYRNVFTFVERIQDVAKAKGENTVRLNLHSCLRGTALEWHSSELTVLEKDCLRVLDLENGWIKFLVARFKERATVALAKMEKDKYTLQDAALGRTPRAYAQAVFRNAQAAGMTSVLNQLSMAWNHLHWEFQRDVPEPDDHTSKAEFLQQLESKTDIWKSLAIARLRAQNFSAPTHSNQNRDSRNSANTRFNATSFRTNLPFSNERVNRFAPRYNPNYPNYQRSTNNANYPWNQHGNQASTNYQNAPRNTNHQRQLPPPRPQLLLPAPGNRASNSTDQPTRTPPNQYQQSDNRQPWNRPRVPNRQWQQQKAYQVDADTQESSTPSAEPAQEYETVHSFSQGDYVSPHEYPPEFYPSTDSHEPDHCDHYDEIVPQDSDGIDNHYGQVDCFYTESSCWFECLHCPAKFRSNNQLHRHLQQDHDLSDQEIPKNPSPLSSHEAYSDTSIPIPKPSPDISSEALQAPMRIISSTASDNAIPGYGFRSWHYITAQCYVTDYAKATPVCLDTGCTMSLGDKQWLKSQNVLAIFTLPKPITVKGIGSSTHACDTYARVDLHFPASIDGELVIAKCTREIHIVDYLKAGLLVGIDILGPEGFVLDPGNKTAYIRSCDNAQIDLTVTPRKKKQTPLNVCSSSAVTIPPHSHVRLKANTRKPLGTDGHYIFEPGNSRLTMYAHIVDSDFSFVVAANNSDSDITIPRHTFLGQVRATDDINYFQIDPADPVASLLAESKPNTPISTSPKISGFIPDRTSESSQDDSNYPNPSQDNPNPSQRVPNPSRSETVLENGITIYGDQNTVERLTAAVIQHDVWTDRGGFVDIPEHRWMRIPLAPGWENVLKSSAMAKVYHLSDKDKKIVDETFDRLHEQGRMQWSENHTPFGFPVFVIWRNAIRDGKTIKKGRAVIDIRPLNKVTEKDVYPIPRQEDIITLLLNKPYISVFDATLFFYQWRVHPADSSKFSVVSHRGQEILNVAMMGFCNSIAYVQRQIELILRKHKDYAKAYVDDFIVFSDSLDSHEIHLNNVLADLAAIGIKLNPHKSFIGFPSVRLLGQKVDALGLATAEEKLEAISKLQFPYSLKELEAYLGLTGWLRQYVPFYSHLAEPLQNRKTLMLRQSPASMNDERSQPARRQFTRIATFQPSSAETDSYKAIQTAFSKPTFLVHHDPEKQLYVDVDASKQRGFGVMMYHSTREPSDLHIPPPSDSVQPIMFLSKCLSTAEKKYWPTELEVACMVWVLRRTRHIVQSAKRPPIFFTDHAATLAIAKQTSLSSSSVDRQNLRLVRASEYIQRFDILIFHKPGKQHVVADALSRLQSSASTNALDSGDDGILDALFENPEAFFSTSLVEMSAEFRAKLKQGYERDMRWSSIIEALKENEKETIPANLPYHLDGDLLYFRDVNPTSTQKLCVPESLHKEFLEIAHDNNGHPGLERTLEHLHGITFYRTRRITKKYIDHCPECLKNSTRRHRPYGSLQPILTPPIPFHTITIDFVMAIPISSPEGYNILMTVSDKFTKRIGFIPGKDTWTAEQWGAALLRMFLTNDWGIPKQIISDRDPKFLSTVWTTIFKGLKVSLLYSTAYHPQSDGQSERTNQTAEIAFRYLIPALSNIHFWPQILPVLQFALNSSSSGATKHSPHQLMYGMILGSALHLPSGIQDFTLRMDAAEAISMAAMQAKRLYDERHTSIYFSPGQKVLLRLHKGYSMPSALPAKFSQQYAGPFVIKRRIGRLAYELDLPPHWAVHPVFSVAFLEKYPQEPDPFQRPIPDHPGPLSSDGKWEEFEVEAILDKRLRQTRGKRRQIVEYLLKWKGYGNEFNMWYSEDELANCKELIAGYEQAIHPKLPVKKRGRPPKDQGESRAYLALMHHLYT